MLDHDDPRQEHTPGGVSSSEHPFGLWTPDPHHQPWTGLAYDTGNEYHILPQDEDDRDHEATSGCRCGPRHERQFGVRLYEPVKHIYRHNSLRS